MNKTKHIDPVILEYANRSNEVTPEKAMDIIGQMYIDSCGISRSDRTLAENASWFWVNKMKEQNQNLPDDAEMFYIMEQRLEEYRNYKDQIDAYDIGHLDCDALNEVTLANFNETDDDKVKITLAAGVVSWIHNNMI